MNAAPAMSRAEIITLVCAMAVLLLFLHLHLLPALLGGLLVFELIGALVPRLRLPTISSEGSRVLAVTLIATAAIGALAAMGFGIAGLVQGGNQKIPLLFERLAQIIENSKDEFPAWLLVYIPDDAQTLRRVVVDWLRDHASGLQVAGQSLARGLGQFLIGMVIGAMLSLHLAGQRPDMRPLSQLIFERATRLANAFRAVVFAQVIISAVNTAFTGIYLALLLPLMGVELPLLKTLLVVTFLTGLIPIVGNLISNTMIFIVSLSHSLWLAFGSLGYLVFIHQMEYFLNARIIGGQIRARAWELLLAMLVMEAAFGLPGLIVAPIYYAYLKSELTEKGLI